VIWAGVEPLGERDGRIALYLADHFDRLWPAEWIWPKADTTKRDADPTKRDAPHAVVEYLKAHGASFFAQLHEAAGGGYPADTVTALWDLVWRGVVSNDTFHALRAFTARAPKTRARRTAAPTFRSRRLVPPAAEGRWRLVAPSSKAGATKWAAAMAQQLLNRHGILTREATGVENLPGGFGAVYPVLKAMEEHGRIRRGYFVAGLGATQFALPGALDLLRSLRTPEEEPEIVVLAATDPANPYGTALRVAPSPNIPRGFTRSVGASVILVDGLLAAYLARGDRQLLTWLPEAEPQRSRAGRAVADVLIDRARSGFDGPRGMLIEEIDGMPPATHSMAPWLVEAGFIAGALGFQATYPRVGSQ
jgi:ATP-dependent Lhr-like helicase